MKTLQEVRDLLETCNRSELNDHAFGDSEVYWHHATEREPCKNQCDHGIEHEYYCAGITGTGDKATSNVEACCEHRMCDLCQGTGMSPKEIAFGHFGRTSEIGADDNSWEFEGKDARSLRDCGTVARRVRNDLAGPSKYSEGVCMPGLTLEGVRKELCND